jgi:hypothetical protein
LKNDLIFFNLQFRDELHSPKALADSNHRRLRRPRVQARQGTKRGGEGDLVQVPIGVGDGWRRTESGAVGTVVGRRQAFGSNSTCREREGKGD